MIYHDNDNDNDNDLVHWVGVWTNIAIFTIGVKRREKLGEFVAC
jgi:hypothetical protein